MINLLRQVKLFVDSKMMPQGNEERAVYDVDTYAQFAKLFLGYQAGKIHLLTEEHQKMAEHRARVELQNIAGIRSCRDYTPRFLRWHQRQVRRGYFELGAFAYYTEHYPFTVELSKGCSLNCYFCAVSAPRFERALEYRDGSWSSDLESFQTILGPGARNGVLYFATDPFDNPDYEKFAVRMEQQLGMFPQTTTALWTKNLDRSRKFLELALGCRELTRYSLLGEGWIDLAVTELKPQLQRVEFVVQTLRSRLELFNSGNVRTMKVKTRKVKKGTISPISGFLYRPVDKTLQTVVSCNGSPANPTGCELGAPVDATNLQGALADLVGKMKVELAPGDSVCLRQDVRIDGFNDFLGELHGQHQFKDFDGVEQACIHELFDLGLLTES